MPPNTRATRWTLWRILLRHGYIMSKKHKELLWKCYRRRNGCYLPATNRRGGSTVRVQCIFKNDLPFRIVDAIVDSNTTRAHQWRETLPGLLSICKVIPITRHSKLAVFYNFRRVTRLDRPSAAFHVRSQTSRALEALHAKGVCFHETGRAINIVKQGRDFRLAPAPSGRRKPLTSKGSEEECFRQDVTALRNIINALPQSKGVRDLTAELRRREILPVISAEEHLKRVRAICDNALPAAFPVLEQLLNRGIVLNAAGIQSLSESFEKTDGRYIPAFYLRERRDTMIQYVHRDRPGGHQARPSERYEYGKTPLGIMPAIGTIECGCRTLVVIYPAFEGPAVASHEDLGVIMRHTLHGLAIIAHDFSITFSQGNTIPRIVSSVEPNTRYYVVAGNHNNPTISDLASKYRRAAASHITCHEADLSELLKQVEAFADGIPGTGERNLGYLARCLRNRKGLYALQACQVLDRYMDWGLGPLPWSFTPSELEGHESSDLVEDNDSDW